MVRAALHDILERRLFLLGGSFMTLALEWVFRDTINTSLCAHQFIRERVYAFVFQVSSLSRR